MKPKHTSLLSGLAVLVISGFGCYKNCSSPIEEVIAVKDENNLENAEQHVACDTLPKINYQKGEGIFSADPNQTTSLCLAELNVALLHFDAAETVALDGYQRGQISKEDYSQIQDIVQYQRKIEQQVIDRYKRVLSSDEDWSAYLSETQELVGRLCTYEKNEVLTFGYLGHNTELFMLMQYYYGIKAENRGDRLERAYHINFYHPALYDVALEDLEIFVEEQKGAPSEDLAIAYDLQIHIYEKRKDSENAAKARENGMKLREQGYTPPVYDLLVPQ